MLILVVTLSLFAIDSMLFPSSSDSVEMPDSKSVDAGGSADPRLTSLDNQSDDFLASNFSKRLHIQPVVAPSGSEPGPPDDATAVVRGLSQRPKSLPPRFFYDDHGSQLFEEICQLFEYYLTRTETEILQSCAADIARLTGPCELVELGSGSSTKTRILLDAYRDRGYPLHYVPVDVSAGILKDSAIALLSDYPTLKMYGLVGTYQLALQNLRPSTLPRRMIGFIGSTLGNLTPEECQVFLSQIAAALTPGDYVLLGVDLQKSKAVLEAAYNDRQGVTAAFNLNMLRHLNRAFDGDFDLSQFEHVAFYNEAQNQIEMHLRSRVAQTIHLSALNLTVDFAEGETIHSEISRKFDLNQLTRDLQTHHLETVKIWTDSNQWFGVILSQLQGQV